MPTVLYRASREYYNTILDAACLTVLAVHHPLSAATTIQEADGHTATDEDGERMQRLSVPAL